MDVKIDRSDVSKGKRAANPNGGTLRASKRAKAAAPASLPPTDYHLSNLPYIPLQKILRFLDARSLEKIRRGSRSLNEFVVLNRSRLAWRRVHEIKITRAFDLEKKIIYRVESISEFADYSSKTEYIKGSPSTTFALKWLATNLANCYIEHLNLREFCLDEEHLHEVAQTMTERNLRIDKLLFWKADIRLDSTSFIRFLNTINALEVKILISKHLHLSSLIDDSFFTYMAKLESFEFRGGSSEMLIQVPNPFDKIPKKFHISDVFRMPFSTVVNAIRDWNHGCEEFGDWSIYISPEECPNLFHLAKGAELNNRQFRITQKGTLLSIRNLGGQKIQVRTFTYSPDRPKWLKIERCSLC